jgi:multiple sugar transport system substrate-binding protein
MSKKFLLFTISIFVILSMFLVSCAPAAPNETAPDTEAEEVDEPEDADEPEAEELAERIQLTVQMSVYVEEPHKRAFDLLKEAYEIQNPNVEIVYYGAPFAEYWDKLTAEIVAGTEADIVQLQGGATRYATYAALRDGETGAFMNLDPYIKGTEWEEILTGQKALTYNGHYIGMSNYAYGLRAVYYSKSMFAEAGIDPASIVTTEDFLEAAIALTKPAEGDQPAQYGFGAVLSTHSFVFDEMKTFICRPVGATYTPNNEPSYSPDNVIVGNDAWNFCFQWWQDMIFEHEVVPPGSYDKADQRDLFWNGTVAMNIDGPWFVGMTEGVDPALLDDLGVIASPDVLWDGVRYPFHNELYNITHLISSQTEHPEEAWKFMEWMASEEAAALIAVSGMIPANSNFSLSEEYAQLVPLNAELSALAAERYYEPAAIDPNIPQAGEMARIMVDAAQAAFITGVDVEEVLAEAQQLIMDALAD